MLRSTKQILKRERAVLGDLAPVSRHASTKRLKKGSRLANRRVSFAPDDQLKTMHLYTKVNKLAQPLLQLSQKPSKIKIRNLLE